MYDYDSINSMPFIIFVYVAIIVITSYKTFNGLRLEFVENTGFKVKTISNIEITTMNLKL